MKRNKNQTITDKTHKSLRFPILIETKEDKKNIAKFDKVCNFLAELYNNLIDIDKTIFNYNCFLPAWKEPCLS
jgi:hypothetical protein